MEHLKSIPSTVQIKRRNRIAVLRAILKAENITKPELSAVTQLSLPTVTQATNELCDMGLVQEAGIIASTGGRRPQTYRPLSNAKIVIGIDITRNHLRISAVNLKKEVVASQYFDFRAYNMSTETEDGVLRTYNGFLLEYNIDKSKIINIGISLPGILDRENCMLKYSHVLGLKQPYSLKRLASLFSAPVYFQNDANSGCLSECYFPDTPKSFVYVSLSNSIGGALISDGKLFEGSEHKALEIGHMTVVPDGKPCYCGHKGHYDAYGSALILSGAADGSLPIFFSELSRGNQQYTALMDEYLQHLARLIYNLRICFDEPVVLGGYVGGYLGPYLNTIRQKIKDCSLFDDNDDYITISHYHFEAASVGIAKYLIEQYITGL